MNKTLLISIIGVFFCFCSADKKTLEYHEFYNNEWDIDSTVIFKLPKLKKTKKYNLDLKIRHTTNYKYQNIFFFIYHLNKRELLKKDTIQVFLAQKNGKWNGRGVSNIRELSYVFQKKIDLKVEDEIRIEQAMR